MGPDLWAWRAWATRLRHRAAREWTVGRSVLLLRLRSVTAQRVLAGRRGRVVPVSPAPMRPPAVREAAPVGPVHRPVRVFPAPLQRDAPTTVFQAVPAKAADLWDEALHVAPRRVSAVARSHTARWAHVLVPAALTCLLGAVGLGSPAVWTDELATWGMATTPWPEFWPVLRYVDAVLAPYYAFMHVWVDIFGDSDVALRAPSLLAMTAAAGLIGAIGDHLAGRRVGLLAGSVFALLASTSRFAVEARPYAMTVLAACTATWLLLRAWSATSVRPWLAYGLAVAVVGGLQLVALLLVAGHAWVTLAFRREQWRRFALAAGAALGTSLVFLGYGYRQRNQVAYIETVSAGTLDQYVAVLFGGVAVAAALIVLGLFSLPLRMPAAVFTAWAVVPTLALIAVSFVLPLFLPRYLLFTTGGWALAAGAALARVRPAWAVAALVLLAGLSGPAQVQLRGSGGHGQDTREAAMVIGAGVQAGDGIVYADAESMGDWTARDAIAHYLPEAYRPQDVLAMSLPRTDGLLLATECPDPRACLGEPPRLWVLRASQVDDPLAGLGLSKEELLREQYRVVQVWHPAGLTVALLERVTGLTAPYHGED